MTRLAPLLVAFALAACGGMPGMDGGAEAVDELTVGNRLMKAGEFELARKAYLREAAESGMTPEVLTALGTSSLRMGRLGQAEDLFRRAIEADPTFVPALNNLGVVLMETGRVAEAELQFRAAFAADSGQSDDIRANLTRALSKLGTDAYTEPEKESFALERRGNGSYRLVSPG
ncbi:Tfp pilus assembly protein PilF [Palleronia marisminoris]|uniref:Tetratricopeptide repeat protein n=1 Tax=Palleronia marisminoris TaxID=315423 RepID=A0A1Y5T8E3_9RHOB|nr:tetratricopeptide repeat protein [Palleronia marisminoris]SFH14973.1 Tfp pilus assembly protein PilF [Palleronia marisminoris]SLN54663.1 Tetratricopeptide repeat protein [Palleronia marisminoris]